MGRKKKASIATSSGEDKLVVRGRGRMEGKNEREEREGRFLFIQIKGEWDGAFFSMKLINSEQREVVSSPRTYDIR